MERYIIKNLGWWGTSPEQIERTRQYIRDVVELGKRYNIEVKVEKLDPVRPLDILNPDVLVAYGEKEALKRFKIAIKRRGL